jgi:Mrp family chromosome partitioning ATPase
LDQIKEALIKARMSFDRQSSRKHRETPGAILPGRASFSRQKVEPAWAVSPAALDPDHLRRHRIIAHGTDAPAQVPFNHLRTRLLKSLKDNNWRRIAITSPSPACGKSVVAVNLALSMARVPQCRAALIDLDLRRSSVARVLGVRAAASIGEYYHGTAKLAECFLAIAPNLFVGLNHEPIEKTGELLQGPRTTDLHSEIAAALDPDVIIFDLPPLLVSDDAIGFIPSVDAVLVVVAAGTSTAAELDDTERQISALGKYVGVILNKADVRSETYRHDY